MSQVVSLDASVLGLVSNPRESSATKDCIRWLDSLLAQDFPRVPAIADYEVRRELLRANKQRGLARLDRVMRTAYFLPFTPNTLRIAARFWAEARQTGIPTARDAALDADVILAAQAREAEEEFDLPIIVATNNVSHLSRYVDARRWEDIHPS
jgi:predicted nucleic acid-binding protein